MFYSQIPVTELPEWNHAELSGAIWEEAVHRVGGYGFTVEDVAKLPFGFRAVLAEGAVRAHIEGDGLLDAVWNDDGVDMFALAADCHRQMGSEQVADALRQVYYAVASWQKSTRQTPRSLEYSDFKESEAGQALASMSDEIETRCAEGFEPMMRYLRANPQLFQ